MKLCDDCIKNLATELSSQAKAIFENVFPILKQGKGLTKREIGRLARLNRSATNYLLRELESSLVVAYQFHGRNRVYYLTETGKRLLELEEKSVNKEDENIQAQSSDEAEEELTVESASENETSEQEEDYIEDVEDTDQENELTQEENSESKVEQDNQEAETTDISSNKTNSKTEEQELNWSIFE
ncbi:hypothetical protein MWH25_05405 [Natroniella acetigena]|uniref:hypothetical protein n=1 Tax=Natroniella acetigena TaxID=52004 RepID=UPI00200A2E54|nr:hypothetical protein [Natroniella acetigena]MCK8827180.1 hypothetical protein [Natroniella acetigena]